VKTIPWTATTRGVLLALYILAAAAVFLYIGFPSEALRTYVGYRLSAGLPGLSVTVDDVRPSLLKAGLVLQGVRIAHGPKPLAALEQLRIQPELLSLFQERAGYAFSGSLGGGDISGRAEIDSAGPAPKASMSARLGGILLQQIPGLRSLYGSSLSGRLDGNLSTNEAGALNGKFTISDAQVELAAPVLDQSRFTFRTVEAELTLQNRSLLLRNGRLKGNEVEAEVSGSIALDQPQAANALNLSGRVTPQHAFLARAAGSLPAGMLRRRAGIPFRISGPLDAPGFSLN
jgi:type II secretion system protein N